MLRRIAENRRINRVTVRTGSALAVDPDDVPTATKCDGDDE